MVKMISTYEEYLPLPRSLSLEEMAALHRELSDEIGDDSDALELYGEIKEQAVRYAAFRASWSQWSLKEQAENDSSRTSCHDSLIIKFNQLARYLKMQGRSASWRDTLGDEKEDPYVRKRIGDFGCYLVFVDSLHAR